MSVLAKSARVKMKDKTRLLKFLNDFGIEYKVYTEPKFICDSAVRHGANESICVRHELDFEFDKNGQLIGTSTTSANSFKKRKIK